MNPNSQNQRWSKWIITVRPGRIVPRTISEVRQHVGRFLHQGFGSAAEYRGRRLSNGAWQFTVLAEGQPAHDSDYVRATKRQLERFFTIGFGLGTRVELDVKLMAGSAQDGTPPSQMLILPTLTTHGNGE